MNGLKVSNKQQHQHQQHNPHVSYSSSSTTFTFLTSRVDMIMSPSSTSTVLAWFQKELALYVDLHLISIPTTCDKQDWLGKPIVCLAHHYFPDQFMDLSYHLQHHGSSYLKALQIFEDRLELTYVSNNDDFSAYLVHLQEALQLNDDATLQDLHIRENESIPPLDFDLTIGVPLRQLWHQWTELAKQESLSSTSTRSPSPRIEPAQGRDWEDIESALQQLQPGYQAFQQSVVDNKHKLPFDLAIRISAIDATHAALTAQMQKPTIEFATTIAYIRNELEFIQAKMLKTTTTDAGIHDLEVRSTKVGVLIDHLGSRDDMDDSQHQHYQALLHRYQLIVSWVDDVRVWFVEAERIRDWIEQRIQQLNSKQPPNALEEVEYDHTTDQIEQWNSDHEVLQKEVEAFDAQDMTRLRAHVKQLTSTQKDLSPADTTTIEITFTTLTALDRLMHLLRRHGYELQMLTLRMAWEQSYLVTVSWVRSTAEEVKQFVHNKARWRPSCDDTQESKNSIINALVQFEQQSAQFDQGQFTTTVNLYQDLDDACHVELPNHLESRQVAIEEAFEELTHRIAFARQVVEQYLMVSDFLTKADQLKNEGDVLRQDIASADISVVSTTELGEKVVLFQESTVRLVTGVAARVPYPEADHPSDQQGNDDANETIRMVIGSRKSALVLFGEALDGSLSALRRALQLQKRAKQLQDEMARLGGWVDERLKAMEKSKVDVFVAGKCALDEADLGRLIKERDGQITKLKGIKEADFLRLQENIAALKQSSATQNNVLSDQVAALNQGMDVLHTQLEALQDALETHSTRLDILGRRIAWETQHAKASLWISNATFDVWDFISHKAQWRAMAALNENIDFEQANEECSALDEKIKAYQINHLKPINDIYDELVNDFDYNKESSAAPLVTAVEHVQRRQEMLQQGYRNLSDLVVFAQQVLQQHRALVDFTDSASQLQVQGQQIQLDIQHAMDTVMHLQSHQFLKDQVQTFSQSVIQMWMQSGSQLPYPACPEDARTTRPSTSDDEISTEVATAVYKTYTDLQALSKLLNDMVQRLGVAVTYRIQLDQWTVLVQNTVVTIQTLITTITYYSFDLTLGIITNQQDGTQVEQSNMQALRDDFGKRQIDCGQSVTDIKHQLETIRTSMLSDNCDLLDMKAIEAPLKTLDDTWSSLEQSCNVFCNQVQVCQDREEWYALWLHQWQTLNALQEAMREWTDQKTWWISSFDDTQEGEKELLQLIKHIKVYGLILDQCLSQQDVLAAAHTAFSQSYKVATNSQLSETQQNDLIELASKLQATIHSQLTDIQQMHERHEWSTHVDQELEACAEKELATESFIQLYARWSPSYTSNEHEQHQVKLEKLHQATLNHVATLNTLLEQSIQQQDESIYRRKTNMESMKHRLEQQDLFLNEVMAQKVALCSVLQTMNEVEALAESAKSQLLSSAQPCSQDVDEYKLQVEQVQELMSETMVYPIRHYRDHHPKAREQDASYNLGLQEMLKARHTRLIELGTTLEATLKSKERLSRRKAAEASYFADANTVSEWIGTKQQSVKEQQQDQQQDDLALAVTQINALQSAVTNYVSAVHALEVTSSKCIAVVQQQQGDDDAEDAIQTTQRINEKQAQISSSWEALERDVSQLQQLRQQQLRHDEFLALLKAFNTCCETLEVELSKDVSQVTESISNGWQDDLQVINSKLAEIKIQSLEDVEAVKKASSRYVALKAKVQARTTESNHYRLKQEYTEGADDLERMIKKVQQEFQIQKSTLAVIHGDEEKDKALYQSINDAYSACCNLLEDEKYDEQRSFYRFLQLNKVNDLEEIDARQQDLEGQWKNIKQELSDYQQNNIKPLQQWQELHVKLNDIKDDALQGVVDRLNSFQVSHTVPAFFEQDASILTLLRHRASACLDVASSLPEDDNMLCFQDRYSQLVKGIDEAETLLQEKKTAAQQHVDFLDCEQLVAETCQQIKDQIEFKQPTHIDPIKESSELESFYSTASTAYLSMEAAHQVILHQLATIASRVADLDDKYDTSSMQQQLDENMAQLTDVMTTTVQDNDAIRRILGHSKSAENITSWLQNCKEAISNVDQQDESIALELASLSQKMVDFQKVVQSFEVLSAEVLNLAENDGQHAMVLQVIEDIVKPNTEHVNRHWKEVQDELKDVETQVEKTTQGVAVARKMKHLLALIGETRDYVYNTKLYDYNQEDEESDEESDDDKTRVDDDLNANEVKEQEASSASTEEQQTEKPAKTLPSHLASLPRLTEVQDIGKRLESVEAEMMPQIEQEMKEIDSSMDKFDAESAFARQQSELKESISSLKEAFVKKYSILDQCMSVGAFLSTSDDVEILQSSLEGAISQAAPHHSLIGTLSRTDLQTRLIELDARFKYFERKIIQSLSIAQQQAETVTSITEKGGQAVRLQLEEMERRWTSIKKQFKTRKIELSRTIDTSQDSKDKDSRIRKSSLPTRKASSLLRDRADAARQRLSPTASSTSSSSSSSRTNSTTRLPSRFLTPPPYQPSKSATHIKASTSTSKKPPLNSYVADPDNDLDIEIGRIVNETPYRVKVKMVPGEVGRYWFGNLNPKLAYCRVLKSKMVMVRVGGGWTELSQFLRDHALLEGDFIPRHKKVNAAATSVIPEEEEPKSPTIQEGFIETHRQQPHRPVTGSPSHSTNTATSGYKEGNKFIAVDSHGNQLQVHMRRASNFMHTSNSSSTTNTSNTNNHMNDYTKRRIARRKEKKAVENTKSK